MKRLALLAVTAFMAVLLSACGESAEKKMEDGSSTAVEQSQTAAPESAPASEAPAAEEAPAAKEAAPAEAGQ